MAEESTRNHADLIAELRNMAARVADRTAAEADREALLAHQRSIENQVGKLGEELQSATQRLGERPAEAADQQRAIETRIDRLTDELKAIAGRLADRSADEADREALLGQQRGLEGQIDRLAEELRGAMAKVVERPASDAELRACCCISATSRPSSTGCPRRMRAAARSSPRN